MEQALHKKVLDPVLAVAEVLKTIEAGGAISDPDPSWTVVHSMQEKGLINNSRKEEELFWSLMPGGSSRKQVDEAREQTVERERAWLSKNLMAANEMQTREGLRLAVTCTNVLAELFLNTIESLSRPEL